MAFATLILVVLGSCVALVPYARTSSDEKLVPIASDATKAATVSSFAFAGACLIFCISLCVAHSNVGGPGAILKLLAPF